MCRTAVGNANHQDAVDARWMGIKSSTKVFDLKFEVAELPTQVFYPSEVLQFLCLCLSDLGSFIRDSWNSHASQRAFACSTCFVSPSPRESREILRSS